MLSADCQDAAESGEQAVVRQGAVHDVAQPVCGDEQAANVRVPQQAVRSRRLLRVARGERSTIEQMRGAADADEQLDQYMALSKKDLQIHITLNELYNTHSLLVQHRDVLVSEVW